ncbi:MAG: hypothetical protein HC892_22715 [Saprospiraceae bacterium]|nr:hypothetical protein [Saprospiraceae bacterium]
MQGITAQNEVDILSVNSNRETFTRNTSTILREQVFSISSSQTSINMVSYPIPAASGTNVPVRVYRDGIRLRYNPTGATNTLEFSYAGSLVTFLSTGASAIIIVEYNQ